MVEKFGKYTPKIDETCFIAPGSAVIGNVEVGKNVSLWHNSVIRGDMAKITIGDNTNIQDCCVIHCVENVETHVGRDVTVGHGAILHSCTVDDCSLIGMGAVVLDGARVGKNCIVGAGAVVTPNTIIPDRSLVLGSPARIKRELTDEEIANMKKNSERYIKLASDYKNNE